uniref:Cna B-type domain-containing protein n=1 Tax=Candidatus Enterococcus willemsii TaxID=1857215 RepID=UPI00403F6CC0
MKKNKNQWLRKIPTILAIGLLCLQIMVPAGIVLAEARTKDSTTQQVVTESTVNSTTQSTVLESSIPTVSSTSSSQAITTPTTESEETHPSSEAESSDEDPDPVTTNTSTEESTTSTQEETKKINLQRAALNIRSLFEGTDTFLSDVNIEVFDGNKKIDYENETVPADATIRINYNWRIPQHLLDDKLLQAGDYYETDLPGNLVLTPQSGELKSTAGVVYGTYTIGADRKVRWTFNDRIEKENDIHGTVYYAEQLNDEATAGENIIRIPVDGGFKEIKIIVRPNGGNSISKLGTKGSDNQTIHWEVSINTNLETLKHATVTDPLPAGTTLKKLTVYPQTVNLKGEVVATGNELIEGADYTINGDVVTFIGKYANTNQSFKLVYETTIEDEKIPFEGGKITFNNIATLKNGDETHSADASITTEYGKLIEKSNPSRSQSANGHVYKWKIKYNYGYKKLPVNSWVKDTLQGDNLAFIQDSVVIQTVDGTTLVKGTDYKVVFNGKEMTITFLNELTTAVNIEYRTSVVGVVDDDFKETMIKNSAETTGGYKDEGRGTIDINGVVKDATVNYDTRKINWTIEVNTFKYEMHNWHLEDTMSEGLIFNKDSLVIHEKNGAALVLGTDYEFVGEPTDTTFRVRFIGDLAKGTNHTYVITYATDFARYKDKFTNTAISHWQDASGKDYKNTRTKEQKVTTPYVLDASKGGEYNAQTKTIKWTTIVNYNQDVLKNASITDPIIGNDQVYVANSAKVYEVTIHSDGSVTLGQEVPNITSEENQVITANLPEGSTKAYALVFETSLDGKVIKADAYKNEASYVNHARSQKVNASVKAANGGSFATKSGKQDATNGNYANWSVVINPSQSTLTDVTITDEPSTNQVLDQSSFIIYGTTVSTDGKITKDVSKILQKDRDYTISVQTNNETGQQVSTIKLLGTIKTAYILEYRSLINSDLLNDTVSNKLAIKGVNEETVEEEAQGSTKVIVSGGTAEGSKASVTLVKVDKNKKTKTPLIGAKLELWSMKSDGSKDQLIRSGETDGKGELKFGNLRANHPYLLIETQAPAGFTVNEELRDGKKVEFAPEAENNLFEELRVENDIPRITFTKVASETKAGLAGATFAIKNAEGQFYNGLDEHYVVQWVGKESQISEETKTALTSNAQGVVEVSGLPIGVYSIKELVAPTGYDGIETEIPFEVVNNQGIIELKEAIADISNEKIQYVNLPITKVWNDANNQDGKRPESVTVHLLADGNKTNQTITLTKATDWKGTFENLRKFDSSGNEIHYTVKEDKVAGYEEPTIELVNHSYVITNTRVPETITIEGTKTWDDKDNQDGKRPAEIIVNLFADDEQKATATVSAETNWTYRFSNLPKYQNGNEIVYHVTENVVPEYRTEMNVFDITNHYTPGETSVNVTKVWDDATNQDGLRPENIYVQLYANGTKSGEEVSLNAANNWTTMWNHLALKENGKDVIYEVKEVSAVTGYTTKITEPAKGNFIITNSHTPETITIKGTKTWDDTNNQDGKRPTEITVRLYADGVEQTTTKVTEETNWTYTFTDLAKYQQGKEIVYTVTEDQITDYQASYDGYNIINTHTPAKQSIAVTKNWQDEQDKDDIRPDKIVVKLLADGKDTKQTLTLSDENNWQGFFVDLDVSKEGKGIVYTVEEQTVKGYEATISGNMEKGYVITNTHMPEKGKPSKPVKPNKSTPNKTVKTKAHLPKTGEKTTIWLSILGIVILLLVSTVYLLKHRKSA